MLERTGEVLRLAQNIKLKKVENEEMYFAFDLSNGAHYQINRTAFWILDEFTDPREAEDVLCDYTDHFDISHDCGSRDFWDAIDESVRLGLLLKEVS